MSKQPNDKAAEVRREICSKCGGRGWYEYGGRGWYEYDDNHAKVCEACCKHDCGWYELPKVFSGYKLGADNACCRAGCGTMRRDLNTSSKRVEENRKSGQER